MTGGPQGLVYGVGALRVAARGDRIMWSLHRAALAGGIVPVVPAAVVAEAYRTEARGDRVEDLLAGVDIEPMTGATARRIGELAARADTADMTAVIVAEAAERRHSAVVASRHNALRALGRMLGVDLVVYGL